MDTSFEDVLLVDDGLDLRENKQYYLIETFKQEKSIGTIREANILGTSRFIRIDVLDEYGLTTKYSKYIAVAAIAMMTPISEYTAIELVQRSKLVNRSLISLTTDDDIDSSKTIYSELVSKESVTSDTAKKQEPLPLFLY